MSQPIGPGDFVECYRGEDCPPVYVGRIYRVVRVWDPAEVYDPCAACPPGENPPCVEIENIPSPDDTAWCSCCFRPVYRPKQTFINQVLTPVDLEETPSTPVHEDA